MPPAAGIQEQLAPMLRQLPLQTGGIGRRLPAGTGLAGDSRPPNRRMGEKAPGQRRQAAFHQPPDAGQQADLLPLQTEKLSLRPPISPVTHLFVHHAVLQRKNIHAPPIQIERRLPQNYPARQPGAAIDKKTGKFKRIQCS
ncbi:hypothetical protein VY88_26250 [Azospirillum thiophilum]|nr:hypothetical protein VY88_26250 [Azospirillum thiophilum]